MGQQEVEVLIRKIISGSSSMSKEELQLYVNNSEEIERILEKIKLEESSSMV